MLEAYSTEGLEEGLRGQPGPYAEMLARAQPLILQPHELSELEVTQIIAFVEKSLTDPDAHPDRLRELIPTSVPSGLPMHDFEYGAVRGKCAI
jgi:hypothetical protein